jgi:hypothetical protein
MTPRPFETHQAATNAVFAFIKGFYNRQRLHSAIGDSHPTAWNASPQPHRAVPVSTEGRKVIAELPLALVTRNLTLHGFDQAMERANPVLLVDYMSFRQADRDLLKDKFVIYTRGAW